MLKDEENSDEGKREWIKRECEKKDKMMESKLNREQKLRSKKYWTHGGFHQRQTGKHAWLT